MRAKVLLILGGMLLTGACGGGEERDAQPSGKPEQVEIRTRVTVAPTPGAEVIATGEVLEGSTLGGSPFCVGGDVLDSHASPDPEVWLIARTVTCSEGEVRMELVPEPAEGLDQTGSWEIVSGTGAFEGLRGSGEMEIAYDADPDKPARETYTGTATR